MKKVAVVGSVNRDLILTLDRFPQQGETVLGKKFQISYGGKGANQAIALNRLKTPIKFFGQLGQDKAGKELTNFFKTENLDYDIHWTNLATGFATIINYQHDNRIMVFSGANMANSCDYENYLKTQLKPFDLILLQCEINPDLNLAIAQWAHQHNKTVILNPAPIDKFNPKILSVIDYLLPNEREYHNLVKNNSLTNIKLVITKGAKGASFFQENQEQLVPALTNLNVIDSTGAGDAFIGGFVYGLAQDYSLTKCIRCGNIVGGKNTEMLGATSGMINQTTLNRLLTL